MPSTGSSIRLGLGLMKAKFLHKKGAIRTEHKKLRKLLDTIKKKEQELDEMGEDRSSSFSSGSPVLNENTSGSEEEDVETGGSYRVKGSSVTQTTGKEVAKASPPKAGTLPPPSAPVPGSAATVSPKAAATASTEGKPEGGKVRGRLPFIPPGEPAPNHKGRPNASGELYPGFPKQDPRYCDACEQLRRGFQNATNAHRPKAGSCPWAPITRKA